MGSVPFAGAGLNALHLILASLMINLATTTYSYISLANGETQRHPRSGSKLHSLGRLKPVFEPAAVCKARRILPFDFTVESPQFLSCWPQIARAPLD